MCKELQFQLRWTVLLDLLWIIWAVWTQALGCSQSVTPREPAVARGRAVLLHAT